MAMTRMSEVIQHLRTTVLSCDDAGLTDGQLLDEFTSHRDKAALETLVLRHGPMVWGVCRRVLRDHHDTEDAFQATFLVLVRKSASIVPSSMVGNWLYGVAHQTALKARATAARRKGRERQVMAMPEPVAAEQDLWGDLQPLLDEELSRLPDKYRVCIVLCELEGKTRKEAAHQLGVPEGTVAGRLARARTMLAKRLAKRGFILSGGALAAVFAQNHASACVPSAVMSATIKTASLLAAGQAASGVVSVPVAALTEGVVKAMFMTKLKLATAALLLAGLVGGVGFASYTPSQPPVETKPTVAIRTAARAPLPKIEHTPKKLLDKATDAANDIKDDAQKAFALMNIATAQAKAGDRLAARKTFEEAVRVAEAIQHEGEYRKGASLMFIAQAQADVGEVDAALKTAELIQTVSHNCKQMALAQIAHAQVRAKNVKGSLKTLEAVPEKWGTSWGLLAVVTGLAESGDTEQALKLTEEIQDVIYRIMALTKIAEAQQRAGDPKGVKKSIDSARQIAEDIVDLNPANPAEGVISQKAWAQQLVAFAHIALGDEKYALKQADNFKGYLRDIILAEVALHRVKAGKVKEANEILNDMSGPYYKEKVWGASAVVQAQAGDFKAADKTLEAIKYPQEKVDALLGVAAIRQKTDDRNAVANLYRQAMEVLAASGTLDTLFYKDAPSMSCATPPMVYRVMSLWAESGDAEGAVVWVDKQESAFAKAVALAGIAEGIAKRAYRAKK